MVTNLDEYCKETGWEYDVWEKDDWDEWYVEMWYIEDDGYQEGVYMSHGYNTLEEAKQDAFEYMMYKYGVEYE